MSGKILIIDPNAHRRSALCQAIQNSLYSCISANDIETEGSRAFCYQQMHLIRLTRSVRSCMMQNVLS